MKKTLTIGCVLLLTATLLSGCENMSRKDRGTFIGAGVGAAAGGVLTHSAGGAVVGGVAGGLIGREIAR